MTSPKSAKTKIAFTGTNSSGKTTTAMEVCSRLKSQHHQLAELVSSQDRKITWKDEHFPVNPIAHYGMITNLIHAEVQATLKGDADIIITDRSVFDLYAIARTDHPDAKAIVALEPMIDAWMNTYDLVVYLPPLVYQEDGKRPPNEFRMRTHSTLVRMIADGHNLGKYGNVVKGTANGAWSMVKEFLKLENIQGILAETHKFQSLANISQVRFFVKERKWESSDIDVWVSLKYPSNSTNQPVSNDRLNLVRTTAEFLFGNQVRFDFMVLPESAIGVLKEKHNVVEYQPNGDQQ